MNARCTLAAPAQFELVVRHSRFLAHALPVDDPEQVAAALQATRTRDASHHCWAWRMGEAYRSSDDGEPAGTAGRPILAAIDGQACDRVVVVVARWFGGIKLGAGGLVRAYGGAAAQCLRQAARRPLIEQARARVVCGFDQLGAVHQVLARLAAQRHAEAFNTAGTSIEVELPRASLPLLRDALREATRGQAQVVEQ